MRPVLPLLLVASALAAPATAATRNFGVSGFDRIRVDGPFRVTLTTGVAPFAKADGPAGALDRVAIEVQGRTLVVRPQRAAWGGYPGDAQGVAVAIELGAHEINSAWLNGAGSLALSRVRGLSFDLSVQGAGVVRIGEADVDQLRVSVAGTGSAAISGRAGKLTAIVRGVSSLDAAGLVAKDAKLGAEGPSTVKAHVTNEAVVDGSGVATITLTGNPTCTVKLIGSASVAGCR